MSSASRRPMAPSMSSSVSTCSISRPVPARRLLLTSLGARSPVKREWWRRFLPGDGEIHTGNDILPWEMEALLQELGWRIVEQRPSFSPALAGANPYAELGERLTERVLQQALATAWQFVAVKPAADGQA